MITIKPKLHSVQPERFTVAIIGDTQKITVQNNMSTHARAAVDYVNARYRKDNIRQFLHIGDVMGTSNPHDVNDAANAELEFKTNLVSDVDFFLSLGNWDMGSNTSGGDADERLSTGTSGWTDIADGTRVTFGNKYIEGDIDDPGTYGGPAVTSDTYYSFLNFGDYKVLLLVTEFGPSPSMMKWLDDVVWRYPFHDVWLLTHSYLGMFDAQAGVPQAPHALMSVDTDTSSSTAPTLKTLGSAAVNGREMWRDYMYKWPRLRLTVSGHVFPGDEQLYLGPLADGSLTQAITEGTFPNDPGVWTLGTGWSIANNRASKTSGNTNELVQPTVCTKGAEYKITYTLNRTAGTIRTKLGDSNFGIIRSESGTYTEKIKGSKNAGVPTQALLGDLRFIPDTNFVGDISNVLVEPEGQVGSNGNLVSNIHVNYQGMVSEISSSLRLLTFYPGQDKCVVKTFNTFDNTFRTGTNEEFEFQYKVAG